MPFIGLLQLNSNAKIHTTIPAALFVRLLEIMHWTFLTASGGTWEAER
jgi:hypothetical protein